MKKIMMAAALLSVPVAAHAAPVNYILDPNHTNILWHADHFGYSKPTGRFGIKDGTLVLDEANPAAATLNVTIDMTGLVTGVPKFDAHLKSADFFNTTKFPTATFKSTKIVMDGKDEAKMHGDLTLLGVTKPIVLDVELNKAGLHPMNQQKAVGFSAETTIKRSDFGMGFGIPNIADNVEIDIQTEATDGPFKMPAEKK